MQTIYAFTSTTGHTPAGPPVQASDGNFYGTAELAGAHSEGTLYKRDTANNVTKLYDFGSTLTLGGPNAPMQIVSAYDPVGNRSRIDDWWGSLRYLYDNRNQSSRARHRSEGVRVVGLTDPRFGAAPPGVATRSLRSGQALVYDGRRLLVQPPSPFPTWCGWPCECRTALIAAIGSAGAAKQPMATKQRLGGSFRAAD